ncbi:MFS transporter [Porticoccaceae bacterium]|nr:MFS transporter [Porticoccaceae bacterium]MDC0494647.1 MFS transporter [bacterium]MDA8651298.1 MFS transporter [Porticoccaceae bacterium]MDA8682544.1 MFS transporter [Porticoccaceae bacterium]MDA8788899.1 MFS transporter [Porticoccaceae bacterium]
MFNLFKRGNFSLFWFGEMISVIGDHISLIAFPWLVLQMTDSAALTGLVFAVQGVPRAILMLAGGALVDRTSPRLVILITNGLRMLLVLSLAYMIHQDTVQVGTVFILAFAFGVADAFFYPASTSILPSLVARDELQAGNAIIQTTLHLGMTLGPVIAAFIIAGEVASVSHQEFDATAVDGYAADREGLARAFLIDGLTFGLSFLSLLFVKVRPLEDDSDESSMSLYNEIKTAILWVVSIPAVRLGFLGMAVIHFFFMPMVFVGIPVWAKMRFVEGAYVYGLVTAAFGAGALIGAISSAYVSSPGDKKLVPYMFWAYVFSGSTLGLIIIYDAYWWAMALFFISGVFEAFFYVHFTTWLQKLTPEHLLGRVMSVLMLMSMGLLPIADAIMGFAIDFSLEITMLASAALLMVFCTIVALNPQSKVITAEQP